MKKQFLCTITAIMLSAALSLMICGCSSNDDTTSSGNGETTDIEEELSVEIPSETREQFASEEESSQSSIMPQSSSEPVSSFDQDSSYESSEATLPSGVQHAGTRKLRYTTSVLSLNVTFPDEFCIANGDYTPEYGIYLQNSEGSATLLLESVTDNTMSASEMASYLRGQYPSAKIYITDQKDIVCKMDMLDRSNNRFYLIQKIRVKAGGYMKIVLCCKPEQAETYNRVFNEINFL